MNYYELLEVSPAASIDVIKNAYKTLAKKYHPDAYKGDKIFAEEKMKVLNEAISVLEDEEKRREYDTLNGIYQNTEIYNDGGGLSINVDENGEPAFFSYSSGFEEDGVTSRKTSLMETIDDFLSKKKTKNKPRRRKSVGLDDSDESSGGDVIEDILNDINELDLFRDISEVSETGGSNTDTPAEDEAVLPAKKSKTPRWYYITITGLITGSVIIIFLILGSLNIGNVMDIMNRLSGSSGEEEPTEEYITSAEEYNEHENTTEEDLTTDLPLMPLEPADLTTVDIIEEPISFPPLVPPAPTTFSYAPPGTTEQPAQEETSAEPPTEEPVETDIPAQPDYTEETTEEPTSREEELIPPETEFEPEEPDLEELEPEPDTEDTELPEEAEVPEDYEEAEGYEEYTETEGH
ncbi:MAG: DnaJ domain-containing protein [Oscillospiraceae bacterium]|nr:DnaJ domain-containing protein [Oscillospiraceae bacterium]